MREQTNLNVYLCYSFCKNRYLTHFFSHSAQGIRRGRTRQQKNLIRANYSCPSPDTHIHTQTQTHTSSHTNQIHCPNNSGKYVRGGAADFSPPRSAPRDESADNVIAGVSILCVLVLLLCVCVCGQHVAQSHVV